jgi:DNA-binding response OmpR family regulator
MAIFKILIDLYIEEFYAYTIKYISIAQIDLLLRAQGLDLEDPEKQIGMCICRIRSSIKSILKDTNANSIIETKKWKGYRLSNQIVFKK